MLGYNDLLPHLTPPSLPPAPNTAPSPRGEGLGEGKLDRVPAPPPTISLQASQTQSSPVKPGPATN
jgi:hypothetical protein